MTYDRIFKKVFGDPNDTDKLAFLLSVILNIPIENIRGNIIILES